MTLSLFFFLFFFLFPLSHGSHQVPGTFLLQNHVSRRTCEDQNRHCRFYSSCSFVLSPCLEVPHTLGFVQPAGKFSLLDLLLKSDEIC